MLSPAPMRRLRALVLERDERATLVTLGRLGAVQLTRAGAEAEGAPLGPPDPREPLARCDRLLARVDELRGALALDTAAAPAAPAVATLDEAEESLRRIDARAGELFARRQRLAQRRDELAAACDEAAGYGGLGVPLAELRRCEVVQLVAGSVPGGALAQLEAALPADAALVPLPERRGRRPVIALASRRGRPGLERALQQAGFEAAPLPADGDPAALAQAAAELRRVDAEVADCAAAVAPALAAVARAAALERQLVEADQCFPRTAATRLIAGWIPAADAAAVAAQLRAATGGRCQLELTPPGASDQADVPVLLRPPWPLRPFAMLVAGFGLPAYRELDPTLFLAVSYLLMFGMMFGDAGHGAVLVLAGALARRVDRRVGWLLVYAGLASIGFGVVYGSYFGITALKEHALWRDPLEGDPLTLMRAAVGLGATMITLGLVLNIINRFRRGDVIGGLLDKFGVAGVIFYWGALLLATRYATLAAQGLVTTAVVLVLGLPLAAFALRGPLEVLARRRRAGRGPAPGGLGAALAESLLDPFEAVLVYLANTVSFVRLAAYALSHAALLLATFMLAAELRRASAAGTVWSVLVVIAGNGIAIVLEAIVAAVQALRLEYYEFFGKFFSGAGRPFQPFRVEGALDRMAARYREAGGGKECDTRKTPGG